MTEYHWERELAGLDVALPEQPFASSVLRALPRHQHNWLRLWVLGFAIVLALATIAWLFPFARLGPALLLALSDPVTTALLGALPCLAAYGLARDLLAN